MGERELLLIYQMGKVASSTIKATAMSLPQYEVHQVHRLVLGNILRVHQEHRSRNWQAPTGDPGGLYLQRDIRNRRPAKVITLVREPIARNISYYFQNLDKILGRDRAHELPLEDIIHGFPESFPYSDDPLTWFDYEFAVALDADIYSSGFAAGAPSYRWRAGAYDILVLRVDTSDAEKTFALRDFLDARDLDLRRANMTSDKESAAAYRAFRETVKFPPRYLDHMLESKYAQFFFDAASLQSWRDTYLSGGSIIPRQLRDT